MFPTLVLFGDYSLCRMEHGRVLGFAPPAASLFTATPTALVVDDDPVGRRRLERLLHQLGVASVCCCSVREALAVLQRDIADHGCVTFTRILSDIVMPEASGEQLLTLLNSSGWPVSIIMVTANASMEQREQCTRLGAAAVLPKPIRKSTLSLYFTRAAVGDGTNVPGAAPAAVALASRAVRAHLILGHDGLRAEEPAGRKERSLSAPRATRGTADGRPGSMLSYSILEDSASFNTVHAVAMGAAVAVVIHMQYWQLLKSQATDSSVVPQQTPVRGGQGRGAPQFPPPPPSASRRSSPQLSAPRPPGRLRL